MDALREIQVQVGIIRNKQGHMIHAFAMPLSNMSNNLAELCIHNGIKNLRGWKWLQTSNSMNQ